ncbi:MAG: bifunctional UDP-N-acetylmuramoyl-tripeptide:D-alanyl-D-alanine ligase/alanine racemase [Cytophagaceae bacterium]
MLFRNIETLCEGKFLQYGKEDIVLSQLLLDSRKVVAPEGTVFFAIAGTNHDGHQYLSQAYQKGVRCFVVEKEINTSNYPNAFFFHTASSVKALQKLVQAHREKYTLPVIGITGSNAKTIVKEWLYQTLQSDYTILRNPKSYNSQIGVPLSVWPLNDLHTLGIFEAGISQPGEMARLEKIIQPSIGIFTNIGSAHDEGFSSIEEKIQEKALLFTKAKVVILCADHLSIIQHAAVKSLPLFTWSLENQSANVQGEVVEQKGLQTTVNIKTQHWSGVLHIPFIDKASVENSMHVVTVMTYLGYPLQDIQKRIHQLHPLHMRMEVKEAKGESYVIDDTYNNDVAGLQMALDFMQHVRQRAKRTIILSDVLESGASQDDLYARIATMLKAAGVTKVITVGKDSQRLASYTFEKTQHFNSVDELMADTTAMTFHKEIILIKGARKFSFEKIVHALEYKQHETRLEVNLNSLLHNLNVYRSRLQPGVKVMAMVKALAYGSGSYEVAQLLQHHGVHYLAVAYADEGVRLREQGVTIPIMVMNAKVEAIDRMITHHLEPEIYRLDVLEKWAEIAGWSTQPMSIHLKWDTGMRRLGLAPSDVPAVLKVLAEHPQLKVASCFTHLAGSDEALHDTFTRDQLKSFQEITDTIAKQLNYTFLRHAANSAAILRLPEAHLDMVRLGIGLYGVESSGLFQNELRAVSTLKTHISQIREVESGTSVGYSRKWTAQRTTKVATIEVGYADGYDRRLSNGVGEVLIHGKRCKIIGNVCMDMSMVDVTDITCEVGDEVILFGENPPIQELADKIGTIGYEVLTGIGDRVKRVYYSEED